MWLIGLTISLFSIIKTRALECVSVINLILILCLLILSGLKVNILLIIKYILIVIKMSIKSLKIKNHSYYYWNDIVFIDDFDIKFFKINKRESRVGIDIYYAGYVLYKLEYITNSIRPLYLGIKSLLGSVEKVNGSSDRYLVIDKSNIEVINVFNTIKEYIEDKIISSKIDGFDKIRLSSDIDLPLGTLIKLKMLTIIIRCIIKKDGKYYPEIYLGDCLYDKVWFFRTYDNDKLSI